MIIVVRYNLQSILEPGCRKTDQSYPTRTDPQNELHPKHHQKTQEGCWPTKHYLQQFCSLLAITTWSKNVFCQLFCWKYFTKWDYGVQDGPFLDIVEHYEFQTFDIKRHDRIRFFFKVSLASSVLDTHNPCLI